MRLLYIDIDSLRADHLGCYGYPRPTTPILDSVAAQGVRFTRYFASDTPCVPSRAALFSGRPGIENGVVTHEHLPLGSTLRYGNRERFGAAPLLAHALAKAGVHTVSFSTFADRHYAGWFHLGFREFRLPSLRGGNEDAVEINAAVLPWLRENARREGWFLHLNYWDVHTLYTEPPRYAAMMARFPAPAWPDAATIAAQQRAVGLRTPQALWGEGRHEGYGKSRVETMPDRIAGRADFETLINGYDGAIRYLDDRLAEVFAVLEAQGVLDETAVIISADHGEAFGELTQYMEHGSATPATHHVPLIVRWPGLTDAAAGEACAALTSSLDFAPTVMAAFGLTVPAGWAGRSLLPELRGAGGGEVESPLVLSHGLYTRQRSVFDGTFLYLRTYHPGTYEYPPEMLFDVTRDPLLTRDLCAQQPERARALARTLRAWEARHHADPLPLLQDVVPPGDEVAGAYLKRLRRIGRGADADALETRWREVDAVYGWGSTA